MNTDTVKVALMEGYTYNSAHKYYSDVSANAVASSAAVSSPTVVNGTFDCADPVVTTPASGHTISSVIFYKDTGTAGTSTLVAHIDKQQDGTTNISLVTNGQNVTIGIHASGVYDL
jgi:hypothetical protein